MHCQNRSILMNKNTGQVISVPCGQWKCAACASLKGYRLSKRVQQSAEDQHRRIRMITLTIADDVGNLYATQQLNRFVTRMHQLGYMKEYFWCKEFQQRGARHFHILVHQYIDAQIIHDVWKIGWTKINSKLKRSPAFYVSKYLTKGSDQRFAYRERRYGCSRGYVPPEVHGHNTDWEYYTRFQWFNQWGDRVGEDIIRKGFVDMPDYSSVDFRESLSDYT